MRDVTWKIKNMIWWLRLAIFFVLMFLAVVAAHIITCASCEANGAECRKISAVTYADRYRDEAGETQNVHSFTDLQNGDILITDSVHTFGWRHGHVAVVTDAENDTVLEAVTFGVPTKERNVKRWSSYAHVVQVRLSDDAAEAALESLGIARDTRFEPSEQFGNIVADFASENVKDLGYSFIPSLRQKAPILDEMTKTQCAHLVWYVYQNFGVDLDSDGGMIVTPKDLYESEKLEVVEKFGFSAV